MIAALMLRNVERTPTPKEAAVLVYEDTTAVVTSRAYQLAETGEFEDFAALKRALLSRKALVTGLKGSKSRRSTGAQGSTP